ncbi:hypothetical protein Tco_1487752, partial [Tanacetum coccineum]
TVGTHDDEAGSSRPRRSRQYKIMEEAMLPRVYHIFLTWGTCPRMLNKMGCVEEIENMLEIKVYEAGSQEEISSSEAWRRTFSDENFNARDYWLSISSAEELHLSMNVASTIRSPILALDTTTLRELIDFEGRLILEDPALGVPHVAIPKGPRPSMQYLYDRMGSMEICQEAIERMAYRQSYQ